MKLLYKPFGVILGILAGLLGRKAFDFVWTKIDDEEPPEPTIRAGIAELSRLPGIRRR